MWPTSPQQVVPPSQGQAAEPQAPNQIDQLREALVQRLVNEFNKPEPVAPTYQPQQLTPFQGFAQARNPQLAGQLEQSYQAPAQARFQQQQAAFEQAMGNRQGATTAAAGLVGAQLRNHNRPLRFSPRREDRNGQAYDVMDVYDSQTGELIGTQDRGPTGAVPFIQPAVPGVSGPTRIPRVGPPGPVGGVVPPAPPGQEEDFRKNAAFIAGSDHLRQAFRKLKAETGGRGFIANVAGQELGETKYGGAIGFSAPNAAFENELRTTLDTMIVAVTGLSFPEEAFKRYRSELPVSTDSEEQAMEKIDNVVRKFIAEQKTLKQTYPAIGGGQAAQAAEKSEAQKLLDMYNAQKGQP